MNLVSDPDLCKRKVTKKLTLMDAIIGKKIRELRTLRGYSQVRIAKAMGITFQQFQKYECGINRICISRLLEICKYCNVDPSHFLDKIYHDYVYNSNAGTVPQGLPSVLLSDSSSDDNSEFEYENVDNKEVLMLIRLFNSIRDPNVRKKAVSLLKVLANKNPD